MKLRIKHIAALMGVLFFFNFASAQEQWIGKLTLNSFDCETQRVCYNIDIKGVSEEAWALGDQNYRLFYDGDNVSVNSVYSLLPETYSAAQTDEVMEIYGQGQEAYSPLDKIDDNLGFLDFYIISYAKQSPEQAVQINSTEFTSVAKICVDVSDEMLEMGEENAMNLHFSQPSTAGQITNQHTLITEIDGSNHTKSTNPIGFLDITYESGADAQLGALCSTSDVADFDVLQNGKLKLFPNPVLTSSLLNYDATGLTAQKHDVIIYDLNYKVMETFSGLPINNKTVNIQSNLAAGVYLLKVQAEGYQEMKEFVILN